MAGSRQDDKSASNSDNQKENGETETKGESSSTDQSAKDATNLSDEELLAFFKDKCLQLKAEIKKHKARREEIENENYELQTKIDEMREIVQDSIEIKTQLENMDIDVDDLLDKIDMIE